MDFGRLSPPPVSGQRIQVSSGSVVIPDNPIIPFIEGDGIGSEVTPAMRMVVDEAVNRAYGGKRRIHWWKVPAGQAAYSSIGEWLPAETVRALEYYRVGIKGPLATPVGGGHRSLNVAIRQELDLFACVRPVKWIEGVPSPVKHPELLDVVIFRENTEDLYMGIESREGSREVEEYLRFVEKASGRQLAADSGIGLKPISETATRRLAESAFRYARTRGCPSITVLHDALNMPMTEGAFRAWACDQILNCHPGEVVAENEASTSAGARTSIVLKDRLVKTVMRDILLNPQDYSVIVTSNLNGDFLSDACAAQVGGLGLAPGANIGENVAVFEATHGTAPSFAGQDKLNPGSLILSACMMLEHMHWWEASDLIHRTLCFTIGQKRVTWDLASQMEGATELKCSQFAMELARNIDAVTDRDSPEDSKGRASS